jgi:hypothetical protein
MKEVKNMTRRINGPWRGEVTGKLRWYICLCSPHVFRMGIYTVVSLNGQIMRMYEAINAQKSRMEYLNGQVPWKTYGQA